MKYLLVLYMCSLATGQCPSSYYAGYQFNTHYDCIIAGYGDEKEFKEKSNTEKLSAES